jgi:ABC-type amino acid transport substrate-binding protein
MNRNNAGAIGAAVFACALALVPMRAIATDARIEDLAQAGKIRLALFLPQHAKDSTTGQLRGIGMGAVAIDIAHALATRMSVAVELVGYPTPPAVVECLKNASCDLAFMGIEPSRLGEVDFSPAVVQFDYTYLVPADSTIRSAADADRPRHSRGGREQARLDLDSQPRHQARRIDRCGRSGRRIRAAAYRKGARICIGPRATGGLRGQAARLTGAHGRIWS